MDNTTNRTGSSFEEKLIIGDHDSVLLFGSNAQIELRNCSERIAKMLVDSSFDFDMAISGVLIKLNEFQDLSNRINSSRRRIAKQKWNNRITLQYKEILNSLEKVTLFFQLQQAQLIKETELLKRLDIVIQESGDLLKGCIENAETVMLNGASSLDYQDNLFWFERLKKRTEDLKISYTLSLQSQLQLKMLHKNDIMLIDKIAFILSNTIPLWQTQMSISLGVKLSEQHLDVQEKVLRATESYIKKTAKKSRSINDIDFEDTAKINDKLKSILQDIDLSEREGSKVRKEIQKLLN